MEFILSALICAFVAYFIAKFLGMRTLRWFMLGLLFQYFAIGIQIIILVVGAIKNLKSKLRIEKNANAPQDVEYEILDENHKPFPKEKLQSKQTQTKSGSSLLAKGCVLSLLIIAISFFLIALGIFFVFSSVAHLEYSVATILSPSTWINAFFTIVERFIALFSN